MFRIVSWLCLCLLSALTCAAQEIEGSGKNGGALFSNANYLELSVPVTSRVGVNMYGFYLGNVRVSIPLLEVPLNVQKHLTLTPSYLFVSVPPSTLTLLTGQPVPSTYRENQFRFAGTLLTTYHGFTLSDRNMYVRRFTPFGQVNRYRSRFYGAHLISFGSYKVNAFAFNEVYHDFVRQDWVRRNWIAAGFDMPITRYFTFQPSYMRQNDLLLRNINFLGIGVIIKTRKLIHGEKTEAGKIAENGDAVTSVLSPRD
jgi:hypothetical protein